MGRTINRVVEEPNKDYLENTAKEIIKSININFLEERYENVIKSVCNAYYSYLIIQAQNNKQDFHGFRDFYYLIKYIFYSLNLSEICFNKNNYNIYLEEVIKKGIYRNFSGFENSENLFLEQFNQNYQPNQANHNDNKGYNYNLYSKIKDNIESKFESRYILLSNDNKSINEQILKYILEDKDYEIISSENLKAYDNEKNGILNLLIKIEVLMNKEIILILKDLNILYPSLYELFNKNFNEYGNKFKFVQISYENQYSLRPDNEKFRIIILVNKDELDIQEKPFLNRFEKQIFSLETLLDEEKTLINNYYDIIRNLKEITGFPNLDYLYKDLFHLFMIKSYNKKENKKQLFVKNLVPLLSQEMIYDLNNNPDIRNNVNNDMDTNLLNEEYINCYKQNYNLKSFLSNINSQKNVIYTYSAYSDNNNNLSKVVKNAFNGQLKIQFKNIKIININEETIKDFIIEGTTKRKIDERKVISFLDGNFDLCIIKINEEIIRNNKINTDIRNLIFEMDKYFPKKYKILLYIIYIKKNIEHINNRYNNENNILEVFLLYNQIFIDNLYNKYEKDEKINIFCDNFINGGESVINSELIDNIWERVFENINIKIKEKNYNYEYIEDIKKHLKENEYVSRQIKTKVNNLISKKILNISEVLRDKKLNDDFIIIYSKNIYQKIPKESWI